MKKSIVVFEVVVDVLYVLLVMSILFGISAVLPTIAIVSGEMLPYWPIVLLCGATTCMSIYVAYVLIKDIVDEIKFYVNYFNRLSDLG